MRQNKSSGSSSIIFTGIFPYLCEICYGMLHVEYCEHKNRVKQTITCAYCGYSYSRVGESWEFCMEPSPGVEPERMGHYQHNTCIYCGRMLTGRQKLYCSNRCKMRYRRNGNKPSQLR